MTQQAEIQSNPLAEFLADVTFFRDLSAEERASLAEVLHRQTFEAGHTIFLVGDPGDELFVIQRGSIEIFVRDTRGEKVSLAALREGAMFGELSLLDNGARSASAIALERSELLVLERDRFEAFLLDHPHALSSLLKLLGERLRNADQLLGGQQAQNPNTIYQQKLSVIQRIATAIADFSGSIPFLVINFSVFLIWIIWNTEVIPGLKAFDPYPFGFLTMAVSLEAIFLSILVLLAQNLQTMRDRVRGDIEYEVNVRAQQEITHLHSKVDLMHAEVLSRLHRMEKSSTAGAAQK